VKQHSGGKLEQAIAWLSEHEEAHSWSSRQLRDKAGLSVSEKTWQMARKKLNLPEIKSGRKATGGSK